MTTFDGERFVPQLTAPHIVYEHWHRYLWARRLVTGCRVLDAACGEGYGSALLAERAAEVVGLDRHAGVIAAAQQRYQRANLRFVSGPVEQIALADAQFDVIVSFETIEHLAADGQRAMLREFRRLLRPGGRLLLSTPERTVYRTGSQEANPFHQHELTRDELQTLLGGMFRSVQLLGQRVFPASSIWPLERTSLQYNEERLGLIDGRFREVDVTQKPLLYLLAICADGDVGVPDASLLIDVTDQAMRQAEEAAAIARSRLAAESLQLAAMTEDRGRALAALAELAQHLDEKNAALLHLAGLQAGGTADAAVLRGQADGLAAELQAVQLRAQAEREVLAAARDEAQRAWQEAAAALTASEQRADQLAQDLRQLRTGGPVAAGPALGRRLAALWQRLRAAPRPLAAERRLQRNLIAAVKLLREPAGLLLFVDTPQPDALQCGRLTVRGWVFSLFDDVLRIEVLVDGSRLGTASYGMSRRDVYDALAAAPSSAVGYEFSAPIDWTAAVVRCTVRALPGLTVIAPADGRQTRNALQATAQLPGPIYYRLGKDDRSEVPGLEGRFALDSIPLVRDGHDVLILVMGSIAPEATAAADQLAALGVAAAVGVVAQLAPVPTAALLELLQRYRLVLTVEAHVAAGGLAALVAEQIAGQGLACRLVRCAVETAPDGFSGSQSFYLRRHGLDRDSLVRRTLQVLGRTEGL